MTNISKMLTTVFLTSVLLGMVLTSASIQNVKLATAQAGPICVDRVTGAVITEVHIDRANVDSGPMVTDHPFIICNLSATLTIHPDCEFNVGSAGQKIEYTSGPGTISRGLSSLGTLPAAVLSPGADIQPTNIEPLFNFGEIPIHPDAEGTYVITGIATGFGSPDEPNTPQTGTPEVTVTILVIDKFDVTKFYTNTNVAFEQVLECIKDTDGAETAGRGAPETQEVQPGDPVLSLPGNGGGSGLDWFDNDGDGKFGCGTNDDLHLEDTSACATGIRNAIHDLGLDCKVLDLNGDLANGDGVDCDVDFNLAFTTPCDPTLAFHDLNGDGVWQPGEDIVNDENLDGIWGFRDRTVSEALLGDPLPIDPGTGKFLLQGVVKKDGSLASYNPGQYYAVTKVNVFLKLDSLWITEEFADCTDKVAGPGTGTVVSVVNPTTGLGATQVVLIRGGIVSDLSSALAASGDLFLTDDDGDGVWDNAEAHLDGLLPGDMVLFYVKFGPGLKGQLFPTLDPMCENKEIVMAELTLLGNPETITETAAAGLVVKKK